MVYNITGYCITDYLLTSKLVNQMRGESRGNRDRKQFRKVRITQGHTGQYASLPDEGRVKGGVQRSS